MIDSFSSKDIIKYIIVLGIIYTILKIMPLQNLNNKDIILLLIIIMFIFIIIDYKCFKFNNELFTDNIPKPGIPPYNFDTNPTLRPTTGPTNFPTIGCSLEIDKIKKEMQTQINELKTYPVNIPTIGCSLEIDKIKNEMQTQINELKSELSNNNNNKIEVKYFESLLDELISVGLLDDSDILNIKNKVKLNLLTLEEAITSLETLKSTQKNNESTQHTDLKYNELPSSFSIPIGDKIANDWNNDYAILDTNKWTVPMPRIPICINNSPSNISPSNYSNGTNLKEWDNSRVISKTNINKQWVNNL